jgi:hypothetical protein
MGVKVVLYGSDGPRYEPQPNVCKVDLAPFAVVRWSDRRWLDRHNASTQCMPASGPIAKLSLPQIRSGRTDGATHQA